MKAVSVKKLVFAALFAALICVSTISIRIPTPGTGGYPSGRRSCDSGRSIFRPGNGLSGSRDRLLYGRSVRRIFYLCADYIFYQGVCGMGHRTGVQKGDL